MTKSTKVETLAGTTFNDDVASMVDAFNASHPVKSDAETIAELRAQLAAKPVSVARRIKSPQVEQNGALHPREGTVGAKLWAICDDIAATTEGGYRAIRNAVIAATGDFNPGNVRTELSVWSRFHNIRNN